MKKFVILVFLVVFLLGCNEPPEETGPAKLISAEQGKVPNDYDDLYEGELVFDIGGKEIKMHLCTTKWNVEEGACYDLTEEHIDERVEEYLHSSRLSGCYFGTLYKIPCEEN